MLKALLGSAFTIACFAGLTGGAVGPAPLAAIAASPTAAETATLTRSGTDLVVTGSIGNLFQSATFSGPNRAEKQDRLRPAVDVAEVETAFAGIRARIAELRKPKQPALIAPVEIQVASIAPVEIPVSAEIPTADPTPIVVASVDPALTSSALDAIDALAAPVPATMSKKLAYAREDLPATDFDARSVHRQDRARRSPTRSSWCMATAIYFEARGESYRGQVAVGQVVMNRVAHPLYPDTICGVVFQNQQQAQRLPVLLRLRRHPRDGDRPEVLEAGRGRSPRVSSGKLYLTEVGYATHYHATYVYPHWAPRMKKVTKIGHHVFYQFKRGWQFG